MSLKPLGVVRDFLPVFGMKTTPTSHYFDDICLLLSYQSYVSTSSFRVSISDLVYEPSFLCNTEDTEDLVARIFLSLDV